jgi:hypothetical protein
LNFKLKTGQKPIDKPGKPADKLEKPLGFYFPPKFQKLNFIQKIDQFSWFSAKPVRAGF